LDEYQFMRANTKGADGSNLGPAHEAAGDTATYNDDEEDGGMGGYRRHPSTGHNQSDNQNTGATSTRDPARNIALEIREELRSLPAGVLLADDGFVFLGTPAAAPPEFGPGVAAPAFAIYDGCEHAHNVVPVGPADYQRRTALNMVREHDARCHAIIAYAANRGWRVGHALTQGASQAPRRRGKSVRLRLQSAMHMIRFSANARDIHLLRGLDRDVVHDAALYHDRQIRATTAAVQGFVQLGEDVALGEVEDSAFPPAFVRAWS